MERIRIEIEVSLYELEQSDKPAALKELKQHLDSELKKWQSGRSDLGLSTQISGFKIFNVDQIA